MNHLLVQLFTLSLFPCLVVSSKCDLTTLAEERHVLQCAQRTLQSTVDVGAEDVAKASVLRLACSDMFLQESQLKREHFGQLPNLEELDIEFCKIRRVPARAFDGLVNLKSISIQSHNADWSSIFMEVDPDSFKNMNHLKDIVLAHNNIWSLPPGMMCGVDSVRSLNVSTNHILEVANLGLGSAGQSCEVGLLEIDLSRNFIGAFRGEDLSRTPKLERLYLAGNRLTLLADDAFSGLPKLQEIDLSDNQLAALPPRVFNASQNLQKLSLQNNSLSLITVDLFQGLFQLKYLNLSRNLISSHLISAETFSSLTGLETLDLSHNKISKVDDEIFSKLSSLREMFLHNNLIHMVEPKAFAASTNLGTLDLAFNKLSTVLELLTEDQELEILRLGNNKIQNLTLSCEKLLDLECQENLLQTVPDFLIKCNKLKTLDLSNNKISALSDGGFSGLDNLFGLSLAGNQLTTLSNNSFSNISSGLNILNLANNNLETIERAAFSDLKDLRALRLDENGLNDINGLVSHMSNLHWLNMSNNNLEWFDYAFIPNSLAWLDISYNQISDLGNFYGLSNFALQTLVASHNVINKLGPGSLLETLVHVRINNNHLSELESNTLASLSELQVVDLQSNQIRHLKPDSLTTSPKNVNGRPRVYISDNPLECDCQLDWLPTVNEDSNEHVAVVADLSELVCHEDDQIEDSDSDVKLIAELSQDDFLCQYETHCFESCLCCNFYACDCRLQCPFGCKCKHDADWSNNIVTCSGKNHTHVPILIPMDTTALFLDGNKLHHISQQNFLGQHRIQKLFLNSSSIVKLSDNSFSGLTDLRILHLEHNKLSELRGYEFSGLVRLRELHLQSNALTFINDITFAQLEMLEVVRLDGNLLSIFPVWKLAQNKGLTHLTLSQNLWSCKCDFLAPFNDYLESHMESIVDYEQVNCVSDNIIQRRILGSEPCPAAKVIKDIPRLIVKNKKSEVSLATILVPTSVAILMLILGFLAICVFRKSIKTWIYSMSSSTNNPIYGGSSVIDQANGRMAGVSPTNLHPVNKLFDVYVMYSMQEADFVHHTLSPTLENGSGSYRLCLHKRDLPSSAPVEDTISVAVDLSERVLIVLTDSYLQTEWPLTRNAVFSQLLSDDSYRDKLVILLIDEISDELLHCHQDLCIFLQQCPVVRWGSPGYLNQLRFFLPEPALLTFQRNITLRSHHSTSFSQRGKVPCATNHTMGRPPVYSLSGPDHSVYNSRGCSEHTYHSIPDHIYQTVEPHTLHRGKLQQLRPVFSNGPNLVLSLEPPPSNMASPNILPAAIHSYTHSTSSGQQLLTPNRPDEYLV